MLCVIGISAYAWDSSRYIFYDNPGESGAAETLLAEDLLDDQVGLEAAQGDAGRVLHVISIYNKFVSSPVEMLFGSGFYTSRYTLKPFEAELREEYGLKTTHLQSAKPLQVTTLAAIVSDLGMVGLLFILYFFYKSSRQILETRSPGRIIFLIFLMSNWIFFLVAYSISSVLAFLIILPNGILVSLARINSTPNQLVQQITKND